MCLDTISKDLKTEVAKLKVESDGYVWLYKVFGVSYYDNSLNWKQSCLSNSHIDMVKVKKAWIVAVGTQGFNCRKKDNPRRKVVVCKHIII